MSFYFPWHPNLPHLHHFNPSVEIATSLLNRFTPIGSPVLTTFYTSLKKVRPHSYIILPPAAPFLHPSTHSKQIIPSQRHIFFALADHFLHHFNRSEQIIPPSRIIYPPTPPPHTHTHSEQILLNLTLYNPSLSDNFNPPPLEAHITYLGSFLSLAPFKFLPPWQKIYALCNI